MKMIFFYGKLYTARYDIERTNIWLGSFGSLLNRFDIILSSWMH